MRIVNKKIILASILLVVVTTGVLIWNLNSNKETQLDSVKLKDEVDNNMFAIMLEQEDGTYKESTDSTWPEDMQYNAEKSGCVDINGNKLDDVLNFDTTNNLASVDTTSTSYCYLYFSLPKTAPGTMLEGEKNIGYVIEGGMYRYQGTSSVVNNNYICFGTSSQSECLSNTDKYLYRIIGITQDNKMKLIKNTSIEKNMWHNDDTNSSLIWPNSDLFKALNGLETDTITPIFIDNSTYDYMAKDSTWYNKIATTNWKYGATTSNESYNGPNMYAIENPFGDSTNASAWTAEVSSKISLMYIHDYYYSFVVGGNPGMNYDTITVWLWLQEMEWTMTLYGNYFGRYSSWAVATSGAVINRWFTYDFFIRPVFFLEPTIQITDGTGLSDDPFVIN